MEEVENEIPRSGGEDENSEGLPDRDIDEVERREDVNNSGETEQKEIDDVDEEAEVENISTPDPVIPSIESAREPSTTTEMTNEIRGVESENDSGEESNEDEAEEEETRGSELHHQSSTVTANVGSECDDGLRTDGEGKCVGEYESGDEDEAQKMVQSALI